MLAPHIFFSPVPVADAEETSDFFQSCVAPQTPSKGREKIQGTFGVAKLFRKVTLDLLAHKKGDHSVGASHRVGIHEFRRGLLAAG